MLNEKKILDEVEKTLHSYDNDAVFEGNPFLLTRIRAEKEKRKQRMNKNFAFRISLNQVLVILILLINFVTFIYNLRWNKEENLKEKLVLQLKEEFQIDQSQNNF